MLANASELMGALVALLFVLYKAPVVWRERRALDGRLLSAWLFGLAVIPALLFQVATVYEGVGRLSGWPNLAWLLSCTFLSLAYYLVALSVEAMAKPPATRGRPVRLYLFLAAYVVLFFGTDVAHTELYATADRLPATWGALLFANAFYGYTFSLMPMILRTSIKLILIESGELRLRMIVMFVAASSLTLLTTLKILSSLIGFFWPALVPSSIFPVMSLLLLISSVLWPGIFLPTGFYQVLLRPWHYLAEASHLFWLNYLCRRIERLHPNLISAVSWRQQLRQPALALQRALIIIQDFKLVRRPEWLARDPDLFSRLEGVDDALAPELLVQAYTRVGRALLIERVRDWLTWRLRSNDSGGES